MEFNLDESMIDSLIEKASRLVHSIHYITLATTDANGSPWCSPLNVGFDGDLTFYWKSPVNCQHSRNIRADDRVFFVLFDSRAPVDTGFGVYFKGRAYQLDDDQSEIQRGSDLIAQRVARVGSEARRFVGENPRRVYMAVSEEVWVNTVQPVAGQNVDGRVKIELSRLRTAVREFSSTRS